MISIIICSRTSYLEPQFIENIRQTIGSDYELIVINNSENNYSIFEAYNLGIVKSKGDVLCFIHDDILFHTDGWGILLLKIFGTNQLIGLLGVAGSKIKTKMPSAWWDCPHDQKAVNIIQHFNDNKKEEWNYGFKGDLMTSVVAIDGVFMAMRKDKRIVFNTKIKGFHNYDLNISIEYQKYGYDVFVTNQILIEHFSIGTINKSWIKSTLLIHKLYDEFLPLKINCKSDQIFFRQIEFNNGIVFINRSLSLDLKYNAIMTWFRLLRLKPYSKFHFKFLKIFAAKC
jgi:glycosyltransferase involved in cell wall biosynthesis